MKVYTIQHPSYESNVFAVTEDGKSCVLIDCSSPRDVAECGRLGLEVKAVLLTHGHYDHICGCPEAQKSGAKIYCGEGEREYIFSDANRSIFGVPLPTFTVDVLSDGDKLSLCGLDIRVIATPGHTDGSVCYLIGDALFSGDTLFCGSIGRCDLPGGDSIKMSKSLKILRALESDFKVYCGHGENTSLDAEKRHNPFLAV